jgi:hypothetical protein
MYGFGGSLRLHKFFPGVAPLTVAAVLGVAVLAACGNGSTSEPAQPAGVTAPLTRGGGLAGNVAPTEPPGEAGRRDPLSEPPTQIAIEKTEAQSTPASQPADVPPGQTLQDLLQNRKPVVVEPGQFRQLLIRDAIAPIYEPQFLPADLANMDSKELVIGVEINGQSRAYPVGPLNRREMVNDVVGGVPILVTW